MLRILGSSKTFCDGLTRRDMLWAGGLGLFGLSLADVLHLLLLLAHDLKVDLPTAFEEKMKLNRQKYPIHKARGSAKKYTEL